MTSEELKAVFWNWADDIPVQGWHPGDVHLRISRDAEDDEPRHVAYAEDLGDGTVEIVLSPRLRQMPMDNVNGVIAHELGHAIDYLYDAELSESDHEIRADLIAEEVFGVEIRYDDDLIQTLGPGVKRPRGLR